MIVNARLWVDTKLNFKWRAHATKIAKSAQIEVEPGISRKDRAQPQEGIRRGDLQGVIRCGMQAVLLETGKKKSPVFSHRTTQGESINIVAEDGLWDATDSARVECHEVG
jgi:hypothetical protein